MKNNKWYVISTFVLGCIVINFAGRILSDRLQLPLWLKVRRCPRIKPSPKSTDQSNSGLLSGTNIPAAILPYASIAAPEMTIRKFRRNLYGRRNLRRSTMRCACLLYTSRCV